MVMAQRKRDKSLLTGHHSAERNAEIKPVYPELDCKPPGYLHPYAIEIYQEFYPILIKAGTLKQTDHQIFISFCTQAGLVRESSEQLKQGLYLKDNKINPAEKQFRLHTQNLLKIATELGLSPKARQGVTITQGDSIKADNKLSKLLNLTNAS